MLGVNPFSRRDFLRTGLAGGALLLTPGLRAHNQEPTSAATPSRAEPGRARAGGGGGEQHQNDHQ